MKKIISIIIIEAGSLLLLNVVVPMILGALLEAQMTDSAGIIGGADLPTYLFLYRAALVGWRQCITAIGLAAVALVVWYARRRKSLTCGKGIVLEMIIAGLYTPAFFLMGIHVFEWIRH